MSWLSDRLKEAVPYAIMAFPFTPWGAGLGTLMKTKAPWLMKSKFMNSILGASLKDAGLKYALAAAQGKKNPQLIAKDALLRGMFTNAYKVGFDPKMMMGESPTIDIADYTKDISFDVPATMGTRMGPGYEEYGQGMMDKYYGPGRGGPAPDPFAYGDEFISNEDIGRYFQPLRQTEDGLAGGWMDYNKFTDSSKSIYDRN